MVKRNPSCIRFPWDWLQVIPVGKTTLDITLLSVTGRRQYG